MLIYQLGVTKTNYHEGNWKHFNINNGLSVPSNYTVEIGEDFEGKTWVLTKKNMVKYYISKIEPENWSAETIPTDKFITQDVTRIYKVF